MASANLTVNGSVGIQVKTADVRHRRKNLRGKKHLAWEALGLDGMI